MFTPKVMTAHEFLLYAEQHPDKRFDFIDGEMVEVSPKAIHGRIQSSFAFEFGVYVKTNPIGVVYTEVLHELNGNKYIPDVCINVATSDDYLTVPPLVAVEIRSDSQSKAAQRKKAAEYIQHHVKMSILVFPGESIEVYRAGQKTLVLTFGDILDGEDVLPGFSIPVDRLL